MKKKKKNLYEKCYDEALELCSEEARSCGASDDDGEYGPLTKMDEKTITKKLNECLQNDILPYQDKLFPFCSWDGKWTYPMYIKGVRKEIRDGRGMVSADVIAIVSANTMQEAEDAGCPVYQTYISLSDF